MRRIRLTVAYDGTAYKGWQIQNSGVTIEQRLNEALAVLLAPNRKEIRKALKKELEQKDGQPSAEWLEAYTEQRFQEQLRQWQPPQVIGASRTDAGVHARGNVAVFDTDSRIPGEKFAPALNQHLPDDIRIVRSEEVPPDWHPRRQHCTKVYEYRIYSAPVPDPMRRLYSCYTFFRIDPERIKKAAAYLVGEHDFRSFCNPESQVLQRGGSAVRTIYDIGVEADGDGMICLRFSGNGFLYHMIRILAGTLMRVGTGVWEPERVREILEKQDRRFAGPTAPACGLTLVGMTYDHNAQNMEECVKDKKKIKGFIFDMDGTIFATEALYGKAWKQVGKELGYTITDEMLNRMRGASLARGAEIFEAVNPGFDYYKVREKRLELVFQEIDAHGVPKKKGLDELFAWLHAHHYKIALGTSTVGPQARRYLASVDMLKDFDFLGTGELVTHGKPDPDLFLLCAEKLGLKPEECCVVEDSVNGLRAGLAAGCYVIGIEDLQDISEMEGKIDAKLDSLDEIIPLFS